MDHVLVLDNHLEMKGSALVHCVQGALRSGIVACAYIVGKCQVNVALALRHAQGVRPIIDVAEVAPGRTVLPGQWLESHEGNIMAAFAKRVTISLPLVVSSQIFRSLVDMDAIEARKKDKAEDRGAQHLRGELGTLKEEWGHAPASGQVDHIDQGETLVDATQGATHMWPARYCTTQPRAQTTRARVPGAAATTAWRCCATLAG